MNTNKRKVFFVGEIDGYVKSVKDVINIQITVSTPIIKQTLSAVRERKVFLS